MFVWYLRKNMGFIFGACGDGGRIVDVNQFMNWRKFEIIYCGKTVDRYFFFSGKYINTNELLFREFELSFFPLWCHI